MIFKAEPMPSRTLAWWHSERPVIDMAPDYQRAGKLWTNRDKAFLIDSILNGYDIPKVYVADFRYVNTLPNKKRRQYAVIDGRQRLEAIFAFFDGALKLDRDFILLEDHRIKAAGMSYSDLRRKYPQIASRFDNYNLAVIGVVTDDPARINELFVRLNRGKPLTGAEIRNAMSGEVPKVTRNLASHRFFERKAAFAATRGQHLNVATKLLLVEFRGRFVDTRKRPLDLFVKEAEAIQNKDIRGAEKRARQVLDSMTIVFKDADELLKTQGPVTIYYWLCRTHGRSACRSQIRPFLVRFNSERLTNRKHAQARSKKVDSEIQLYDRLDRNTNDQRSMMQRYEILENRFLEYLEL